MGHASLVTEEGSQVNGLLRVVTRESLDSTTLLSGTLLGVESHGPMTGCAEFPVRLKMKKTDRIKNE